MKNESRNEIKIITEREDFSLKTYVQIYTQLKIIKTKNRSPDYYIMLAKQNVFTCVCTIKI